MQGWVGAGGRLDHRDEPRLGPRGCRSTVANLHWAKWELRQEGRGSGQLCGPGSCTSAPAPRVAVAAAPAPALGAVTLHRSENLYGVFCWRVRGNGGALQHAGTWVPAVESEGAWQWSLPFRSSSCDVN